MKNLKRVLALSLSAVLLLSLLAACGDSGEQNSANPTSTNNPDPTQTVQPSQGPASDTPADLTAFYERLAEAYEYPMMMPLNNPDDPNYLEGFYPGLSGISTEQLVAFAPAMSSVVCEIALVQVANASDVNAVKDILQARIDAQVGDPNSDDPNDRGLAWYPESIEVWQNNSRIVSNGNYVMLIAREDCDAIVNEFNALFK